MADALALPCGEPEDGAPPQQEPPPPPIDLAPPPSQASQMEAWDSAVLAWLSSLPGNRSPPVAEIDAWLHSVQPPLPEELGSLSGPQLHQRILAVHASHFGGGPSRVPQASSPAPHPSGGVEGSGVDDVDRADGSRGKFQRAEHWNPVYSWLESLDTDEVVSAKDVKDWFLANPEIKENLSRNSRYHLLHYIQRVHMKILRRKGRVQKSVQMCKTRTAMRILSNGLRARGPIPCKFSSKIPKGKDLTILKKNEAFLRYELLTELESQLASVLSKSIHVDDLVKTHSPGLVAQRPVENVNYCSVGTEEKQNSGAVSMGECHSHHVENFLIAGRSELNGLKRKRTSNVVAPAWSLCEASFDINAKTVGKLPLVEENTALELETAEEEGVLHDSDLINDDYNLVSGTSPSFSCGEPTSSALAGNSTTLSKSTKNIIKCLQGREWGSSWAVACSHGAYAGRNKEKWIPFIEGWKSLGRQFEGPAVLFGQRSYSSWVPTWCAYTSSAAVAQPFGRTDQSVQKVLDVRFHPEGLAQLVCSSNEAPNELLLYNLLSGKAIQLSGHNCQIQAVEFAVRGASIVSCGGSLMKVWDATTGSCLFTLGPIGDDRASIGHTKKISAMTVNGYQSCLVVTSGGQGDGKLLLWNALTGELAADLNMNLRSKNDAFPSIEAMEFCNQNLLVSGSDSAYGGPAVVQLWDIESPQSYLSVPASDSYITSLKTNPSCNTVITGAGNGAVDLYDIRTCRVISHLLVGSRYEVTSVGFSKCGTYFHASSTSNSTLVWDTRLMPMNRGQIHDEKCCLDKDLHSMRPLHCLSHGKQMPTAEHAGQLPGHVDEGDQGVNDAKWLQREPVLVTVSGNGSIAMWDVTLGRPCVRHLISHTRCVNTVAVAPNDEYLCSGGDDQKVVLYRNTHGISRAKWRLSHPLTEAS